jgi:hypothetical protein
MKTQSTLHYLTYYYPPIPSIASKRNFYLFGEFSKRYTKSILYVSSNKKYFESDGITQNPTIPTLDYRTIVRGFKKSNARGSIHFDETKKQSRIIRFLIKLNETMPFSLLVGEGGLIYIISGIYRLSKDIRIPGNHTVFTAFRPTSNVLIGCILKRLFPSINWIVSMHDIPILEKRPNTFFPRLQTKIWKQLLKRADQVITVSDGVSQAMSQYDVEAVTLLNGIEIRKPMSAENHKFTIAFTGSTYRDLMDPSILFEAINDLIADEMIDRDKLQITYAGKDSPYWKEKSNSWPKIQSCLDTRGLVSTEEALTIQQQANINYLMTWNDNQVHGILSGKLFEYIGARNPIVVVVQGSQDPDFEKLVDEMKFGKVFYTSDTDFKQDLKNNIQELYNLWRTGHYQQAYNDVALLKSYSWENNVDRFF